MKKQSITLNELKGLLREQKEFRNIDDWKFKHIPLGEMQHTYKVSKGRKVYFVKEVKPHEAQAEYFLTQLKLPHLPWSSFPDLLEHKVLVREFISGRMLRSKNIDLGLLRDFAKMRNTLADKKFFDKHNIFGLKNYGLKDNGFYAKGFDKNLSSSLRGLRKFDKYRLKVVDQFKEILRFLNKDKKSLVKEYHEMPMAKQHQDLREDNIIIGKDGKQGLIDWGVAFGYNPFMYDVAPFLVNNPKALATYVKTSDICKRSSKEQIDRWLYLGLAARFLDVIRSRLHSSERRCETKKDCKKYLEYEYKTYKELLR